MKNNHSQGREPHPIDVYVGNRVRLRRVYLGYSQDRVAKALGVTFQQIQKYERGGNRISASKLFEISVLLDVPVAFFFEGADDVMTEGIVKELAVQGRGGGESANASQNGQSLMAKRETLQVITNYYSIRDQPLRRDVLALMKSLSKSSDRG